ncbi:MAG: hypothetical protein KatS3mg060_3573 [Dehalococcoidia bacterium]|nr:MAG: hypothetical protein KatS3mg060_3573 [Dehalococcoidia bacterium]
MKITAAVLRAAGAPLSLESVELGEPRSDEVVVRIVSSGNLPHRPQCDGGRAALARSHRARS